MFVSLLLYTFLLGTIRGPGRFDSVSSLIFGFNFSLATGAFFDPLFVIKHLEKI